MSDTPRTVKRFKAPGPWVTRELRDCVQASDYDKLQRDLAAREEELAASCNAEHLRQEREARKRAEAERDAAVKDAERYRHMRAFDYSEEYCSHVHQMLNDPEYRMESLDSVIPSGPSNHIDAAKVER